MVHRWNVDLIPRPAPLIAWRLWAPQCLAHLHEEATEHVFAGAVAAITPEVVVFGVFDEAGVAGVEEDTADVVVLLEFRLAEWLQMVDRAIIHKKFTVL